MWRSILSKTKKLLNEAKVNANNANHNPNKPIAIRLAVAIWPKDEETMADIYAVARIM